MVLRSARAMGLLRLDGIFSSEEGFSLSTEDPAQSIGRLRHDRRFLISTVPICAVAEEYSFSLWPPLSGELRDGCSA
ncbi:hypothetical protein QC761_0034130 [Podospora bellae-mahoneyi]|uniref:Uncharacterized protein n=1 Tax=Podospora bellae-mahoneyi TaxID=2093777 RepID=A0ABR0FRD7_9PEZI|nr:hypothetical protein QC761_0034130 [Podospora bellae-mahoneyi]